MAWKAAGKSNMAFVILNRYLDLADACEEPGADMAQLDSADWEDTDVPCHGALPAQPYASEAAKEEVITSHTLVAAAAWC